MTETQHIVDEEDDEYILRIKRSGCYPQHIALQDCHWETKDWRKCKTQMEMFKLCAVNAAKAKEMESKKNH
jgi:cytochrome c oxidase assembly factor 4